jgi:hypothetical protein
MDVSKTVPPEVLVNMFNSLDRQNLRKVRTLCRAFNSYAIPLLFNQVVLYPNQAAFDIADLVITRFKLHITTIVLFQASPRELTRAEFETEFRERMFLDNIRDDHSAFQSHMDLWFSLYTKRRKLENSLYNCNDFAVGLSFAFLKLPRLRKLIIGQPDFRCAHMEKKHLRHLGIKRSELCNVDNCRLSHEEHIKYQPLPRSLFNPEALNLLRAASFALGEYGHSITELDMEYYYFSDVKSLAASRFLSLRAFDISMSQSHHLGNGLSRLKRLHLGFDLSLAYYPRCLEIFREGHTATALSRAINLESLYLVAFHGGNRRLRTSSFAAILGGCRFPKLRSLVLEGFMATEDELRQFVQASPSLLYLLLSDIVLISGSWKRFGDSVRPSLKLQRIMLEQLLQMDDKGKLRLHFGYSKAILKDFFLRAGPNPISERPIFPTPHDPRVRRPVDQLYDHYLWIHQDYERPPLMENRTSWIDVHGFEQSRNGTAIAPWDRRT